MLPRGILWGLASVGQPVLLRIPRRRLLCEEQGLGVQQGLLQVQASRTLGLILGASELASSRLLGLGVRLPWRQSSLQLSFVLAPV